MTTRQIRERATALAAVEPASFLAGESDLKTDSIASLSAASTVTLQALMLSRMNAVANLKKDIGALISELAEQMADAKIAELILSQRSGQGKNGGTR